MNKHLMTILCCFFSIITLQVNAQITTVITIALPEYLLSFVNATTFAPFEEQHPNVEVVVVSTGFIGGGKPYLSINNHLNGIERYAQSADVLMVDTSPFMNTISIEATIAEYYLDLNPLINADATLSPDEYHPQLWNAYQWNAGFWAIPADAVLYTMFYDPVAFNNNGLSYPTSDWQIEDYLHAAENLAPTTSSGTSFLPLKTYEALEFLFASQSSQGFYDASQYPATPDFSQAFLEATLEKWVELEAQGIINRDGSGVSYDEVPLIFDRLNRVYFEDNTLQPVPLPNGQAGVSVRGFAVSSGTSNPEIAYQLAKFASTNPDLAILSQDAIPAKYSEASRYNPVPADYADLFETLLANSLLLADIHYAEYLNNVIDDVIHTGQTVAESLSEIEEQIQNNLVIAQERATSNTIVVNSPTLTPQPEPDEVIINFSVVSDTFPLPFRDEWNALVDDFTQQHSQPVSIRLQTSLTPPLNNDNIDCFYASNNIVDPVTTANLLPIDPLLNSDPSYHSDLLLPTVLEQVQQDNITYAYPITVQPLLMYTNLSVLSSATPTTHVSLLTSELMVNEQQGNPELVSLVRGNQYLMMLIIAYDGLPFDYRVNPPSINFTAPQTLTAIQQVLDLIQSGNIAYYQLANQSDLSRFNPQISTAIYIDAITDLGSNPQFNSQSSLYQAVLFPIGINYSPISYEVGAGYILRTSPSPELCYEWLRYVSENNEFFNSVPASTPLIDQSSFILMHISERLADPQLIVIPPQNNTFQVTTQATIENYWFNRALDNAVLSNSELITELQAAQNLIEEFRICITQLQVTPTNIQECAQTVDPSIGDGR